MNCQSEGRGGENGHFKRGKSGVKKLTRGPSLKKAPWNEFFVLIHWQLINWIFDKAIGSGEGGNRGGKKVRENAKLKRMQRNWLRPLAEPTEVTIGTGNLPLLGCIGDQWGNWG